MCGKSILACPKGICKQREKMAPLINNNYTNVVDVLQLLYNIHIQIQDQL